MDEIVNKKLLIFILPLITSFSSNNKNRGILTEAKKVVIFDTAQSSSLKWTTHSNAPVPEEGWLEESVTDIRDGVNTRSYVTCEVDKDHVDNWVRTPYIERGDARRLNVELKFTIRDCKLFPRTARTCKETFTLYFYESDLNFANRDKPAWSDKVYTRLDRITADSGRFSDRDNVKVNVEARSLAVTKKGVYFAFRDEGACVSLLGVRIHYEVCEETVTNFAWFPETPAGPDLTSIQSTTGHCVDNASPPSGIQPKFVCKADGSWDLLSGGCQCNPGYRADGQRCVACEVGTYKENPGFGQCQSCPPKSSALNKAANVCVCDAGYYRAAQDPKSMPCTRPPSRPEVPELISVDQTSAVIKWTRPADLGGRNDLWYRIECQECPPGTQYLPAKTRFNTTRLTMVNLEPSVVYTVFVYAENDVSSQVDGLPMYAVVEVTTKQSSPVHVVNFKIDSISETQAMLSWDPPQLPLDYEPLINSNSVLVGGTLTSSGHSPSSSNNRNNGPISGLETELDRRRQFVQYYQIRYQKTVDKRTNFTMVTSLDTRVTIDGLSEHTEYYFEVRPYTSKGWGAWCEPKYTKTLGSSLTESAGKDATMTTTGNSANSYKLLLSTLVVFVICMILGFMALCYRRKLLDFACSKRQLSDLDTLEYKTDQTTITPDYNSAGTLHRKFASPFNAPPYKPYVDPANYEDPNLMLKEFANEIDSSCVIIEEIIGGGEFGEVCKGQLRIGGAAAPAAESTVAIKTLKPGSSEKARSDFLTEASIMGQFNHVNVIKLKGVVTRSEPVMIITEYMQNGSLDSFLRVNDGKLDSVQLVHMLCGVAQGMKYLSDKSYVHRDLAARNVLVDGQLCCKIADFGLSRGIEGSVEQAYTTKGGKIPVRWTAPEAITYRKFTSASDVWSFGVVMWEVMSYGERPYWEWTNQQVIQAVDEGYRLPPPMDCPHALHRLMLECWHKERQFRPTFCSIVQTLHSFVQCPELLLYMAPNSSNSPTSTATCMSQSGDSLLSLGSPNNLRCSTKPLTLNYCGYGTLKTMHHAGNTPDAGNHGNDGNQDNVGYHGNAGNHGNAPGNHGNALGNHGGNVGFHGNQQNGTVTVDDFLRSCGYDDRLGTFLTRQGIRGVNNVTSLVRLTPADLSTMGMNGEEQQKFFEHLQLWRRRRPSQQQQQKSQQQQHFQPSQQKLQQSQQQQLQHYGSHGQQKSQVSSIPNANFYHQQHKNEGFFV